VAVGAAAAVVVAVAQLVVVGVGAEHRQELRQHP